MTPGARVQAAIDLLDEILGGTPADRAVTGWARRSRFAGSKDRAAVRDHVYQALRCLRSYGCLGGANTGRGVMIGALRAAGADPGQVFSGVGHAPAPLSDEEAQAGSPVSSPGDRMDIQDWLIPHFINALGSEVEVEAAARLMKERAPVMLRVNIGMASVDRAVAALARDGVTAEPVPVAATALRVTEGARRVALSAAYRDGLVEIQDGSSQSAMEMVRIPAGGRVLDYCAGGGGKVLALAARSEAAWFAHDAAAQRMNDLPTRAKRAGASVTLLESRDLSDQPFDLVLCDVPCSGSGTWRRTPDAKWRLTPADLAALNDTQDRILDQASLLVAPGGRLVYATCSLLTGENEDRIEAFVARNPAWQPEVQHRWAVSDMGDGFFLAQLSRSC